MKENQFLEYETHKAEHERLLEKYWIYAKDMMMMEIRVLLAN